MLRSEDLGSQNVGWTPLPAIVRLTIRDMTLRSPWDQQKQGSVSGGGICHANQMGLWLGMQVMLLLSPRSRKSSGAHVK